MRTCQFVCSVQKPHLRKTLNPTSQLIIIGARPRSVKLKLQRKNHISPKTGTAVQIQSYDLDFKHFSSYVFPQTLSGLL